MALQVNAVNNINDYSQIKELIENFSNNYAALKEQKENLAALFEGNFATMGANSDQAYMIENEMTELQALINSEKSKIQAWQKIILDCENDINAAKDELDGVITKYIVENEKNINAVNNEIALITKNVIDKFARGEISEEDVAKNIQTEVGHISKNFNFNEAKITTLQDRITDNVNKVTTLINQMNSAYTKVSSATSALQLLNEMYQVQIMPTGKQAHEKKGGKPVYSPEMSAYVDELYAKYHATATAGKDQYSANNKQIMNIAEALGIQNPDGTYTKAEEGAESYPNSILQEMYDKGFSYKEAMYACEYIFGTSKKILSYNFENDTLTLAKGHGKEAKTIFDTFDNQAKTLWGKSSQEPAPTPDPEPDPTPDPDPNPTPDPHPAPDPDQDQDPDPDPTPDPTPDPDPTPTPPKTYVKRTDPIGWSVGNKTFDFVIDRDGNNKFDGANEFLGADNGFDEMKLFDADGNGVIENDELNNLMIISKDHANGAFGFMTAKDAGVSSIDLNSFKNVSKEHVNINDNIVKGTFNITLQNRSVTGYQSLDDVDYLDAVYGDRYEKEMASTIDYGNKDNKEAIDSIRNFSIATGDTDEIVNSFQEKVKNIMKSFNSKKADAQQEIEVEKRELKQTVKASVRLASTEVEDIITKRETEKLQNLEYEQRNLETEREALENQKSTLELQLEDIYNKSKTEPEQYEQEKFELEQKLEAINAQLEALNK